MFLIDDGIRLVVMKATFLGHPISKNLLRETKNFNEDPSVRSSIERQGFHQSQRVNYKHMNVKNQTAYKQTSNRSHLLLLKGNIELINLEKGTEEVPVSKCTI